MPETEHVPAEPETTDDAASQPQVPPPDPTKTGSTEDRIRAAFSKLADPKSRADFVKLTEVRALLGNDLTREEIDATLLAMVRTGFVHLAPDSDRRGLTQADHDSAVRIGNEDKHFLAIEPEDDQW